MSDNSEKFVDAFVKSLSAEKFVKMTLGNYKGADRQLQKISVRIIETKKGPRILFQYHFENRESVKHFSAVDAARLVREYLTSGFQSGHLFTTENDYQLDIGKRNSRLNIVKPTFTSKPGTSHNRNKKQYISADAFYLKALGITTDSGEIKAQQQDKWRQINKFVEILASLVDNSLLRNRKTLRIVDMGSGKGYLTFAVYDFFTNVRGLEVAMTGVDNKRDIVCLCNDLSAASGFEGLKFINGTIADFDPGDVDVLIALHACDTATDDSLFKGIMSKADLIVAAPCCHKEIRRQINPPDGMNNFLKHGILMENTAEIVTDGLRSLLLERSGYATKVFEFISAEHTPKNNMIAATRTINTTEALPAFDAEIENVKKFYRIEHQRLEDLLTQE